MISFKSEGFKVERGYKACHSAVVFVSDYCFIFYINCLAGQVKAPIRGLALPELVSQPCEVLYGSMKGRPPSCAAGLLLQPVKGVVCTTAALRGSASTGVWSVEVGHGQGGRVTGGSRGMLGEGRNGWQNDWLGLRSPHR